MGYRDDLAFYELIGQILVDVTVTDDEVLFKTANDQYKLLHHQQCCESVYVEDVCGDVEDLIGSVILVAEEVVSSEVDPYLAVPTTDESMDKDLDWAQNRILGKEYSFVESHTWTFYKIDTAKGGVTIRFLGESNGYYSESVDFVRV